ASADRAWLAPGLVALLMATFGLLLLRDGADPLLGLALLIGAGALLARTEPGRRSPPVGRAASPGDDLLLGGMVPLGLAAGLAAVAALALAVRLWRVGDLPPFGEGELRLASAARAAAAGTWPPPGGGWAAGPPLSLDLIGLLAPAFEAAPLAARLAGAAAGALA